MSKKIKVPENIIKDIKQMYENELLSDRKISKKVGYSRDIIKRIIRENHFVQVKIYKNANISKEELEELYIDKKMNIAEVSKILGCSKRVVSTKLYEYGIPVRKSGHYKINITKEELERLYLEEKKTEEEIASIYNCSISCISHNFKKYKIKFQKRTRLNIPEDLLINLYITQEFSIPQLAIMFKCNSTTITRRLEKAGIIKPKLYKTLPEDQLLLKCSEGFSVKELASHFKCSEGTIHRNLQVLGISPNRSALCNVTYEDLYKFLITQKSTLKDVAHFYSVGIETVKRKLEELNLNVRQERAKKITEEKIRDLYFNKGFTQQQIAKYFDCGRSLVASKFKEYGIRKEFKVDQVDKELIKQYYIEGTPPVEISKMLNVSIGVVKHIIYDADVPLIRTPENKKKARQKAYEISLSHKRSKAEIEIEELFPTEFINTSSVIGLELDLWYPEKMLAIEYNGDYWHSVRHARNSGLHLAKLAMCKNHKIQLINIFERDWQNKQLHDKIKVHIERILYPNRFREVRGTIKNVCNYLKRPFECAYNLEGVGSSEFCVGEFCNKELLTAVSYDITGNKCVISRCTTRPEYKENYNCLFERIKELHNLPIIIRCDNRYYDDKFIDLNLFSLYKDVEPDLFYVLNKKALRKNEASTEYLNDKRCYPVYDCGYTEWIWK